MFQQTLLRVSDPGRFNAPIIVGSETHESCILFDAETVGVEPAAVILEPIGRGTAPAMIMAALIAGALKLGDSLMVVPSTHLVRDPGTLIGAIDQAHVGARHGALLAFGIRPPSAETDCTYLRKGPHLFADQHDEVGEADLHRITEVHERPNQETAGLFLSNEEFYWSSGMFLFPLNGLLREVRTHAPELLAGCQQALLSGSTDTAIVKPGADALSACPSVSIEEAVMSKTDKGAIVPTGSLWADIGSWKALWQSGDREEKTIGAVMNAVATESATESPEPVQFDLQAVEPANEATEPSVMEEPVSAENLNVEHFSSVPTPVAVEQEVVEPALDMAVESETELTTVKPGPLFGVESMPSTEPSVDVEAIASTKEVREGESDERPGAPDVPARPNRATRKTDPGTVLRYESVNAHVQSTSQLTAVMGLVDVVVVNTGDALIVTSQECAQKIHDIAKSMQKDVVAGWEGAVLLPDEAVEMVAEAAADWAEERDADKAEFPRQDAVFEAA